MQQLTCSKCGQVWEREPQRGRPPKLCPDCKTGKAKTRPVEKPVPAPEPPAEAETPEQEREFSTPSGGVQRRKRGKTAYEKLNTGVDHGDLRKLPLASRKSGWCTDYDPAPVAVHEKCDGDLGKYRCPCDCHDW
ncbi:MAG: hypothetical protein LC650_00480 [Actinobacteria bacterium]|nr:hypothetical protein [Actinomycetota bacterium]